MNQDIEDRISFVGDWLPRRTISLVEVTGSDCNVGNLECVISNQAFSSTKAHAICLDEKAIDYIGETGFAALSVANNHVNDAGSNAFREMRARLACIPGLQIYGTNETPFSQFVMSEKRIAVIGSLEKCSSRGNSIFPEERVTDLIRDLRGSFDEVLVTPHWGKEAEFTICPSPRQQALALQWFDAGAKGVLGHHPHSIHGIQEDQGRRCYYSIGNFEFIHSEAEFYELAKIGLVATYHVVDGTWTHDFLNTFDGAVRRASGEEAVYSADLLEVLSTLVNARIGYWKWAQLIGKTYIEKNTRSWMKRIKKNWKVNLPKWLVWSLLPSTLFLKLGRRFGDVRLHDAVDSCVKLAKAAAEPK